MSQDLTEEWRKRHNIIVYETGRPPETEGTVIRMRGHGFYTVALANGHEVLARMSGRMSKNHIRVIQDDRVLLAISPTDWSQGRIVYRYK